MQTNCSRSRCGITVSCRKATLHASSSSKFIYKCPQYVYISISQWLSGLVDKLTCKNTIIVEHWNIIQYLWIFLPERMQFRAIFYYMQLVLYAAMGTITNPCLALPHYNLHTFKQNHPAHIKVFRHHLAKRRTLRWCNMNHTVTYKRIGLFLGENFYAIVLAI